MQKWINLAEEFANVVFEILSDVCPYKLKTALSTRFASLCMLTWLTGLSISPEVFAD